MYSERVKETFPSRTDSLKSAVEVLIADFSMLESWNDRYEYIISLGRELPPYPEDKRQEQYEVQGCQSRVWLYPESKEGRLLFHADSDAVITKGLVAMLVQLYSGRKPSEIMTGTLDFLKEIGLTSHLTPSRVNGLQAMFRKIQLYAAARGE